MRVDYKELEFKPEVQFRRSLKTEKFIYVLSVYNIHMAGINIQFTQIEIQIAKHIFKHYKDKYNARQLAKLLYINHAHANKLCHLLADKQIVIKENIGNAIYFSFNYQNKLAIKFMEYVLSQEENEIPKWLVVPLHSLRKFKPFIQIGLIFGSSVTTKDFNDIDVLLVYDSNKKKEIENVKTEIRRSHLIEKPIRYVDIAKKDILSNKEDKIFYSIISNNLVFHNPEAYVGVIKKCHK